VTRFVTRVRVIRWVTAALTVIAFAGSYRHTHHWMAQHWTTVTHPGHHRASVDDPGPWGWVTAAMPEIMVGLSVLRIQVNRRDPVAWFVGSSAVTLTLWANGSAAGPGTSGLITAMWPAYAALCSLALSGHADPVEAQPVTQKRATVTHKRTRVVQPPDPALTQQMDHLTRLELTQSDPAAVDPVVQMTQALDQPDAGSDPASGPVVTQFERGVIWVMAREDETGITPSRPEITAAGFGSDSTAKRIRAAVRAARAAETEKGV
jgi:hypothetical protein